MIYIRLDLLRSTKQIRIEHHGFNWRRGVARRLLNTFSSRCLNASFVSEGPSAQESHLSNTKKARSTPRMRTIERELKEIDCRQRLRRHQQLLTIERELVEVL